MKLYTDETGKFQMYIPLNWEYKNPTMYKNKRAPNSFGLYDNMIGAFQISCKLIDDYISKVIKQTGEIIQKPEAEKLIFREISHADRKQTIYLWTCAVDDHYILITYIFNTWGSKKKTSLKEFKDVRETITSLKFIKPQFRDIVLSRRRYSLFIASMAANIDLINKAYENGSFIELVILTANRIDALLRLSLILSEQIDNKHANIDSKILFQGDGDKIISERQIYTKVFEKMIISQDLFNQLELLYQERNKVVHRYIITDIRTEDVLDIASRYYKIENKIDTIVNNLEHKQYMLKVGLHGNAESPPGKLSDDSRKRIMTEIRDKHGHIKWGDKAS